MNQTARIDFTGTWVFNSSKSVLQIPSPDSTVFVIDHREPLLLLSRTHVIHGKSDTFELSLTTDGKEVVGQHGGLYLRSRVNWDGESLIFETHITQGENVGTNTVRYTLSAAGDVLVAEERLRSRNLNYDNRWILDKQR